MHKSLVLLTIAAAMAPAAAFAQATSGGQAPMADGSLRSTDLGGGSLTSQYLQQQSLNNLPGQKQAPPRRSTLGPSRPAKAAELTAGATVNDKTGIAMARIEQVDPDGIVVSLGTAKVKVPAEAFGHNKAGLLLDMTKAEFEQVVASANAAS